jgi:uncharacterized membrane protein
VRAPSGVWPDERVERTVGRLLRSGVILASVLVLAGGVLSLSRHGASTPEYRVFHGEPADLRGIGGILRDAEALEGRGLVQLGLLLLLATPVARVALTIFAFVRQRDWLYAGIALFVLGVLVYSLASAAPGVTGP